MADTGLRVAVTGASGYVGSRLIERLERETWIEFVLTMDARPSAAAYGGKVAKVQQDITHPFPHLFAERRIDTVVHLAYVLNPGRRGNHAHRVNVSGAERVLEACEAAEVKHTLYLSSTSVYGAHPDNPGLPYGRRPDPTHPRISVQRGQSRGRVYSQRLR